MSCLVLDRSIRVRVRIKVRSKIRVGVRIRIRVRVRVGVGVKVKIRLLLVLRCFDWALDCQERDPLNVSTAKRPAEAGAGARVGGVGVGG